VKLYLLNDPSKPHINPMFSHVGTWSEGATTCKVCGKHNQVLIEPLQIEWEDGSVHIGDFSWCSYTAIVLDPVKKWLLDNRFEARFGRVEVVYHAVTVMTLASEMARPLQLAGTWRNSAPAEHRLSLRREFGDQAGGMDLVNFGSSK
jgi:hypothetical protein